MEKQILLFSLLFFLLFDIAIAQTESHICYFNQYSVVSTDVNGDKITVYVTVDPFCGYWEPTVKVCFMSKETGEYDNCYMSTETGSAIIGKKLSYSCNLSGLRATTGLYTVDLFDYKEAEYQKQEAYRSKIKEADIQMDNQRYAEAKTLYQEALGEKSGDSYASNKIREAEENIKAEKNKAQFDAQMSKADQLMSEKKYAEAKTEYNKALGLKPDDEIAKARISEIDKRLEEQKSQQQSNDNQTQDEERNNSSETTNAENNSNHQAGNTTNQTSSNSTNNDASETEQKKGLTDADRQAMQAQYDALVIQNQQMEQSIQESVANLTNVAVAVVGNMQAQREARLAYQQQYYDGILRQREKDKIQSKLKLWNESQQVLVNSIDTAWQNDLCWTDLKSSTELELISTYANSQDARRIEALEKMGIVSGQLEFGKTFYINTKFTDDRSKTLYSYGGKLTLYDDSKKTSVYVGSESAGFILSNYSFLGDSMYLSGTNTFRYNFIYNINNGKSVYYFKVKDNTIPLDVELSPDGRYMKESYFWKRRYLIGAYYFPYKIFNKSIILYYTGFSNTIPDKYIDLFNVGTKEKVKDADSHYGLSHAFLNKSKYSCTLTQAGQLELSRFPYQLVLPWNSILEPMDMMCTEENQNVLVNYVVKVSADNKYMACFAYNSKYNFRIFFYDLFNKSLITQLKPDLSVLNDVYFNGGSLYITGFDLSGFEVGKEYNISQLVKSSGYVVSDKTQTNSQLFNYCNNEEWDKALGIEPLADKSNSKVLMALGFAYLMKDYPEKAITYFDLANKCDANFSEYITNISYWTLLESSDAIEFYDFSKARRYIEYTTMLRDKYTYSYESVSNGDNMSKRIYDANLQMSAYTDYFLGEYEQALYAISQAPVNNEMENLKQLVLISIDRYDGKTSDVISKYSELISIGGDNVASYYFYRALLYKFNLNDSAKAMTDFEMVRKKSKDASSIEYLVALHYLGKPDKALEDFYKYYGSVYPVKENMIVKHYQMALFYAAIGDKGNALSHLRISLENGNKGFFTLSKVIEFDAIRNTEEFQALLKQYGNNNYRERTYTPQKSPIAKSTDDTNNNESQQTTQSNSTQTENKRVNATNATDKTGTKQIKSTTTNTISVNTDSHQDTVLVSNNSSSISTSTSLNDAEYQQLGTSDAATQYQCKNTGAAWVSLTCLCATPVIGLVPALIISKTPPADKNLDYKNSEMMKNTAYQRAYIQKAHEMKKKEIWSGYKQGVGVFILLCILLAIQ